MNFVPCRLEHNGSGLAVRLTDTLSFSVPASRSARYQPHAGKALLFGLRPEHITDPRYERSELRPFSVTLDVVEPMGMETVVYFKLDGIEVCGRVEPSSVSAAGQPMRLSADLNQMHLIDPQTDLVL